MNTAQVDPIKADFSKFPNFSKAKALFCTLKEGMSLKNMYMLKMCYILNNMCNNKYHYLL